MTACSGISGNQEYINPEMSISHILFLITLAIQYSNFTLLSIQRPENVDCLHSQTVPNVSNPKPGHTTGMSGRVAHGAAAGQGRQLRWDAEVLVCAGKKCFSCTSGHREPNHDHFRRETTRKMLYKPTEKHNDSLTTG